MCVAYIESPGEREFCSRGDWSEGDCMKRTMLFGYLTTLVAAFAFSTSATPIEEEIELTAELTRLDQLIFDSAF